MVFLQNSSNSAKYLFLEHQFHLFRKLCHVSVTYMDDMCQSFGDVVT